VPAAVGGEAGDRDQMGRVGGGGSRSKRRGRMEGGGEMGHGRRLGFGDPVLLLGGLVSSGKEENMGR
jgi:hypothetical protein